MLADYIAAHVVSFHQGQVRVRVLSYRFKSCYPHHAQPRDRSPGAFLCLIASVCPLFRSLLSLALNT